MGGDGERDQGIRTGLGHEGIICVSQTQFSSFGYKTGVYLSKITANIKNSVA